MSKNAWRILHDDPPALIRLCARRRVRGKTVRAMALQEIAITSGLPLARVQVISQSTSWDGITIPEAERFIAGCNFDPLDPADRNRQSAYERSCKTSRSKFAFLKKSPWWLSEFLPLIQLLRARKVS